MKVSFAHDKNNNALTVIDPQYENNAVTVSTHNTETIKTLLLLFTHNTESHVVSVSAHNTKKTLLLLFTDSTKTK